MQMIIGINVQRSGFSRHILINNLRLFWQQSPASIAYSMLKESIAPFLLFCALSLLQLQSGNPLWVSTLQISMRGGTVVILAFYIALYSRAFVVVNTENVGCAAHDACNMSAPSLPPLSPGDLVVAVGSETVSRMSASSLRAKLDSGVSGEMLQLKVVRMNLPQQVKKMFAGDETVNIRKGVIAERSVEFRTNNNNIAILKISSFRESTYQEVKEALFSMPRSRACWRPPLPALPTKLVIDLRGNAGGDVWAALQVASLFIPWGRILGRIFDRPTEGLIHRASYNIFHIIKQLFRSTSVRNTYIWADTITPLLVLVDEKTASAAELLAWSLKDHRRATFWGKVTYGKSIAQVNFSWDI